MNGPPTSARGQALVESLVALPVLLLAGIVAFHLLAAGYAGSLAGGAAEAGALALAAGRDPAAAARGAVPGWSRARMRVRSVRGRVTVTIRPPGPVPALAGALEVSASAAIDVP